MFERWSALSRVARNRESVMYLVKPARAAAALVRTVVQLSLQKVVVERGVEWNGTVQTCYMEWLPKDPPGTAYGARMQVYNLFVLNCLRIRRLRWIEQVSWNEPFEPSAFSAPMDDGLGSPPIVSYTKYVSPVSSTMTTSKV